MRVTRTIRATQATAMFLACAVLAGCGSQPSGQGGNPPKASRLGQIGAELVLGSGVVINQVDWTLTNGTPPAGFTSPDHGNFDVSGSGSTFTGLIAGIPAGTGYDLTFTATSTDTKWVCSGHATPGPFAVLSGQTVLELVHLTCKNQEPKTGSILVNGSLNSCATADDFTAMPLSRPVGSTIALQGTASDSDMAPSPLSYSFVISATQPTGAGTGTLQNVNAATGSASLRCDSFGPVSITLSVSDGDSQCTLDALQILVQCTDACHNTTCAAPSQCHGAGVCDHATGACSYPPGNDGASCNDGNPATLGDVCNNGVCAGFECLTASDCPGTDGECRFRACNSGTCGFANAPAGTPSATQVAGDCDKLVCNGSGSLMSVADNADLPNDNNQCTSDGCVAGVPSFTNVAYGTACSQTGGQICNAGGSCFTPTFRVVRVGTGTGALTSSAAATFVDEYTQASPSTLVGTVTLPTTAITGSTTRSLMLAGNDLAANGATGGLSLSGDGRYLVLAGYDAAAGTPPASGIALSPTATFNRIVARIDASGNVDTSTRLNTAFAAAAVRGATTDDGTRFWVSGAGATTGGIWYVPFGVQDGVQLNTTNTVRWLNVFSGQLYCSNDGTGPNIATIGSVPPPTSGSQTLTGLPASFPSSGQSPYGFALVSVNGVTTLYMADDTSGGIKKWTLSGATWTLSATSFTALNTGTAVGFRGLAAMAGSSAVTLIAGTAAALPSPGSDRLVKFVDDGSSTSPVGNRDRDRRSQHGLPRHRPVTALNRRCLATLRGIGVGVACRCASRIAVHIDLAPALRGASLSTASDDAWAPASPN